MNTMQNSLKKSTTENIPTDEEIAEVKREVEAMKPESKGEAISYFDYVWKKHHMKTKRSDLHGKALKEAKLLKGKTRSQVLSFLRSKLSSWLGK